ncbi:hypothetical protein [Phyllobacterium bourgognense]|uniref:Uncharacterized protein n=1 Tax=Phyllobacterium bourgognense TaxID=314236 RepID=A0A368Z043_9HYPH|nr:hypothetical protein [Phyllobacterium bourgognense]RCW83814.1 hypothetical protein C7476_105310 [Phyllobacterium bourgognense]
MALWNGSVAISFPKKRKMRRKNGKGRISVVRGSGALRKQINAVKERDEFRMPAWAGFVWGTLFGFAVAAWLID